MATGVDVLAASSYAVLLLHLLAIGTIASVVEERSIYLILMEGEPVAFHGDVLSSQQGRRFDPKSEAYKVHANKLVDSHDQVLESTLDKGSYNKLYSFKHVLNGFAVHTTPSQVVVFLNELKIHYHTSESPFLGPPLNRAAMAGGRGVTRTDVSPILRG
ncbi:hypothetical protein GOBAR_AA07611 [Gossypium barbadense]|uniref:Inhibitor I9 domain-containing protein n=1 Tax=Gossypium barbadense TaxID=3634 RepID=A0A2P5YBN6_GOSBA|nr:hypothetical protein GOBAR_AA07611 [Gossypium barbadense]